MDYPLGDYGESPKDALMRCLNPYSNGLPSRGGSKLSGGILTGAS